MGPLLASLALCIAGNSQPGGQQQGPSSGDYVRRRRGAAHEAGAQGLHREARPALLTMALAAGAPALALARRRVMP